MENMIKLKYFYGDEPDRFCFYRIPKVLFTKEYFSGLSTDAKVLYGLLLDQMSLSRENRWLDEENRVYIKYSIQRACAYLGCKKDKAIKLFAELDSEKGIGLIERVKCGQGRADVIYVKSFEIPQDAAEREEIRNLRENRSKDHNNMTPESLCGIVDNSSCEVVGKIDQSERPTASGCVKVVDKTDRSEKPTPRSLNNRPQEVGKTDSNNNIQNDNNMNKSSVMSCHADTFNHDGTDGLDERSIYIDILKEQVGYDDLLREEAHRFEKDKIDGIINMIADIAVTTPPDGKEWVNSRPYDHEVVKSRLLKTDRCILEHVLARMKENTTKIRNMRAYLLTALYNAKDEMNMSIDSQVNYDWYGGGLQKRGVMYA